MENNKQTQINEAEQALLHVYNRFSLVLDHGAGVYLYDTDGKKYLDFASGIAVMAFGYGNKEYNDALKAQIDKLIHTSNYYYNIPAIEAAKKLAGWIGYFSPTAARRPSREPSRRQKNMLIPGTAMRATRSLR